MAVAGMPSRGVIRTSFILLVVFAAVAPVYFMVVTSLKSTQEYAGNKLGPPLALSLEHFSALVADDRFLMWVRNSFFVTVTSVAVALGISILGAYAFARLHFPGRNALFVGVTAMMAVPVIVLVLPLFQLFVAMGMINNYFGLIAAYVGLMVPYTIYFLTSFFRDLPSSVFEAATIDGASHWRIISRLAVPLSRPAIITLAMVNALWAWNELLLALVLLQDDTKRTLMVGLTVFQDRFVVNVPATMAGLTLAFLPMFLLYVFGIRYFVNGIVEGSTK